MRDFKKEIDRLRPENIRPGPMPFRKLARLTADMLDQAVVAKIDRRLLKKFGKKSTK